MSTTDKECEDYTIINIYMCHVFVYRSHLDIFSAWYIYSVFLVNNIYSFHLCSVIPLYVVYKTYCVYSSAKGGIKLLHT